MYYTSKAFANLDAEAMAKHISSEGFDPILIHDRPGYVYPQHHHPEAKLLVFLEGSMQVTVEGQIYECVPGDKVFIPGNTLHSAIVGNDGCTFFWSEKMLR